ncbi:MAG: hypothetical protein EAZ85_14195, partial [Bacteroidetes bacterium]
MENQEIKSYNFSTIKYADLEDLVVLNPILNYAKFDEWFGYDYVLSDEEIKFFEKLIIKHSLYLSSYMEEDLKMKFLAPIFWQVDFMTNKFHDWYDASLSGTINGVEVKGFTDIMIASGTETPRKPYFFIQEFKPSIPDKDPRIQLLAELLVTIEKNKTTIMRGGYIIGRNWHFVILEKIGENEFQYFVSKSFDSLDLEDLTQIYIILQAVKHKYCQD